MSHRVNGATYLLHKSIPMIFWHHQGYLDTFYKVLSPIENWTYSIHFWTIDAYICVELLNNSPIIIVLGTILGSLGFFLILLYMVIACSTFKSCLLYSWILFTWISKIEAGLILIFVCSSRYWASFNLFWALIWKRNGNLAF